MHTDLPKRCEKLFVYWLVYWPLPWQSRKTVPIPMSVFRLWIAISISITLSRCQAVMILHMTPSTKSVCWLTTANSTSEIGMFLGKTWVSMRVWSATTRGYFSSSICQKSPSSMGSKCGWQQIEKQGTSLTTTSTWGSPLPVTRGEVRLATKVVLNLTEPVQYCNHHIYFDQFFMLVN